MEWSAITLLWNTFLTVSAFLLGIIWKNLMDRVEAAEKQGQELQHEINKVEIDYVERSEIARIEDRIDNRFDQIQTFFISILEKK